MSGNQPSVLAKTTMQPPINHTKKILREGGIAFGTMATTFRAPSLVPLMAASGWDYLILDNEHNAFDSETIHHLALVASYERINLLVRIPSLEYHHVARTLDLGVDGLVVPHVETREEAELLASASRYYPYGERGASRSSKSTRYPGMNIPDYLEWANRELLRTVQLETIRGVRNADSILSVEGIDAVMIGPFDLSQSLGCPGETDNPEVASACEEVIAACRRNGVSSGIHVQSVEKASSWISRGMRFITCKTDAGLFNEASMSTVNSLRKLAGK